MCARDWGLAGSGEVPNADPGSLSNVDGAIPVGGGGRYAETE